MRDPQISTQVFEFLVFTGDLGYAQQIIRQGDEPEIKIWNSIIENQLINGYPREVFAIYLVPIALYTPPYFKNYLNTLKFIFVKIFINTF